MTEQALVTTEKWALESGRIIAFEGAAAKETADLPPIYRRAVAEMVREILAQGKTVIFTVRGDSMAPTLQDGDQVRIAPASPGGLQLSWVHR